MPIRVLLVDDHAVVRDGVSYLLNAQPDMKVVGGAQTAWQAVQLYFCSRACAALLSPPVPGAGPASALGAGLATLLAAGLAGAALATGLGVGALTGAAAR